MSGLGELQVAGFLGDNCALVFRGQFGHKVGHKPAGFLRIQVTNFFRNIHKSCNDFVMTLLRTFLKGAASSTNLNWKLLTTSVSNKLAWLLLHILGRAGRLIHSPTLLWSLAITHLLHRLVALSHCLVECLLFEGDGALLLKILLTNLLHGRFKLSNISVVALLCVPVGALQDGLLLQGGHCLLLLNTAQPSLWVSHTSTEVNSTRNEFLLSGNTS